MEFSNKKNNKHENGSELLDFYSNDANVGSRQRTFLHPHPEFLALVPHAEIHPSPTRINKAKSSDLEPPHLNPLPQWERKESCRRSFIFSHSLFQSCADRVARFATAQRFPLSRLTSHFSPKAKTKLGFTLSEVLITLAVIGVLAALTIPGLIQKTQDKESVTSLKKAYSVLSQAYTQAINDNGPPDTWGLVDYSISGDGANTILDRLSPYLKVTKSCYAGVSGCFPNISYKHLNVASVENLNGNSNWSGFDTTDGFIFDILVRNQDCTSTGNSTQLKAICGDIGVDINGFKGPNVFGKDYFRFWFTKYGIVPKGSALDTAMSFNYACVGTAYGNGESCTAWVIYNENRDYIKCPSDLSWGGNHSCP